MFRNINKLSLLVALGCVNSPNSTDAARAAAPEPTAALGANVTIESGVVCMIFGETEYRIPIRAGEPHDSTYPIKLSGRHAHKPYKPSSNGFSVQLPNTKFDCQAHDYIWGMLTKAWLKSDGYCKFVEANLDEVEDIAKRVSADGKERFRSGRSMLMPQYLHASAQDPTEPTVRIGWEKAEDRPPFSKTIPCELHEGDPDITELSIVNPTGTSYKYNMITDKWSAFTREVPGAELPIPDEVLAAHLPYIAKLLESVPVFGQMLDDCVLTGKASVHKSVSTETDGSTS